MHKNRYQVYITKLSMQTIQKLTFTVVKMLNKFCVMFSNFTYDLISYHRLVVERELWSGGSRISFLCVLLNDGIHTCNKHTVVTQDISELPCNNVTFM